MRFKNPNRDMDAYFAFVSSLDVASLIEERRLNEEAMRLSSNQAMRCQLRLQQDLVDRELQWRLAVGVPQAEA